MQLHSQAYLFVLAFVFCCGFFFTASGEEELRKEVCTELATNYYPTAWFYHTNQFHQGVVQSAEKVAFQLNYSIEYHAQHDVEFTCNDARDIIAEAEVADFMEAFKQLIEKGKGVGSKSSDAPSNLKLPKGASSAPYVDGAMLASRMELAEDELVVLAANRRDLKALHHLREMLHSFKHSHTHIKTVYSTLMDTTRQNADAEKADGVKGVATEKDGSIDYINDREGEREHAVKSETMECQRVYRAFVDEAKQFFKEHDEVATLWRQVSAFFEHLVNNECVPSFPQLAESTTLDDL